jgi:hypothetical protein
VLVFVDDVVGSARHEQAVLICGKLAAMGRAGNKPRKAKQRLGKVPKYEEPNTFPAAGLTGSTDEVFGSRYGHSADRHRQKEPGRFGSFVLRVLGMNPKS